MDWYASRSRTSRLRSNPCLCRSYASRNERSTREENISSPRGFEAGGMGAMGTDELRFETRFGEGERRRGLVGVVGEGGEDGVLGNRKAKGLNGSLLRRGG